ncbi:unnamed protein product [Euphydryas editha]|uniref:Reverse transcriptase domain-containing protein n=1 Tax=Euphydryas editha TaxID=104508 RepID=A0AAU9U3L8_EUPED|nr:unnamed protein product [Euphydryas editha]
MGDFNTCLLKNDSRAKRLTNIISSSNLTLLPSNATHFLPNCSPSKLDLMLVSSSELVDTHGQYPAEAFSYHDLVYLSYRMRPPKAKPTITMRRSFKNFDNDSFLEDLNNIDWGTIQSAPNMDDKLNVFNSLLTELFDKHAPLRPVKLKHLPAPWLTQDIKSLMLKRNAAKSKFKLIPSENNHNKYKKLRNLCSRACRDAQSNFIDNSIKNNSPARIWRFLESLGIGRQRSNLSSSIDLDALNNHFAKVKSLDNRVKLDTLKHIRAAPLKVNTPFELQPVTSEDVRKHILSIKSDASGSDGINRKLVLLVLDHIIPVLTYIFNFSLSSNTFPNAWQHAHVIPIPKINNPSLFSHYRPISILPFLSKVLERIVFTQLNVFLLKNRILSPYQSGFRTGHSTVTALVKVCDDIRFNMDNKLLTIAVLLDFSNAFNSVDHDILLALLRSIGLSANTISRFSSYLRNRQQRIVANDTLSSYVHLSSGVPQGGVLSPLIFSIFIDSIPPLLSSYHLYADDLQLYVSTPANDIAGAINKINVDLSCISNWCKSYGLCLNAAKSQVTIIGSPGQICKVDFKTLPPITLNSSILNVTTCVKNLGLLIDNSLSWSPQITEISRKLFASIGSLKRWKNLLPLKVKISLAHALLLPILDYADSCFTDLTEEKLDKLERLQNMCIRFIFGLRKFDHVSSFRARLRWLPIRYRRNLHTLVLLYSILYNPYSPSYLKERFCFLGTDTSSHLELRSRSDNRLKLPTCHTRYFSNSFTVKAVNLWNSLPFAIRYSESIAIFKCRLFKYYLARVEEQ